MTRTSRQTTTQVRSSYRLKIACLGVTLLAALVIAACGDDSGAVPARYRDFSADPAVLASEDLPAGWQTLPSEDLPSLRRFFPPTVELEESAITVASNGSERPADLQMVAVGVTLLSGEEIPPLQDNAVVGLAFLAADPTADLSRTTIASAVPVDHPTEESVRLKYSAPVNGAPLITDALNFREGQIAVDVEVVYPEELESAPALDVEELAEVVLERITEQLQ